MIRTSVLARDAELNALAELATNGKVRIYAGKRPSSLEADFKPELLAECRLNGCKVRSGSLRADDIDPERSATLGIAKWFQVVSAAGDVLWDGTCTGRGKGGDAELDHVDIQSGADVTVTSLVYTLPE